MLRRRTTIDHLYPSTISDGTIVVTTPTGHTYTTKPAAALRIQTDRALNDAHVAQRNIPPPI
ncbi:MAG TPA: hypothetical protein VIU87_00205 [Mycobacterium sp.]